MAYNRRPASFQSAYRPALEGRAERRLKGQPRTRGWGRRPRRAWIGAFAPIRGFKALFPPWLSQADNLVFFLATEPY